MNDPHVALVRRYFNVKHTYIVKHFETIDSFATSNTLDYQLDLFGKRMNYSFE